MRYGPCPTLANPRCFISPPDVRPTPRHPPHPTSARGIEANPLWVHDKHFWTDTDSVQVMWWHFCLPGLGVEYGVTHDWIFN